MGCHCNCPIQGYIFSILTPSRGEYEKLENGGEMKKGIKEKRNRNMPMADVKNILSFLKFEDCLFISDYYDLFANFMQILVLEKGFW